MEEEDLNRKKNKKKVMPDNTDAILTGIGTLVFLIYFIKINQPILAIATVGVGLAIIGKKMR